MMNATCSLRYRWVFCALAIGSLSFIAAVVVSEATGGEGAKDPADGKAAKRNAKEAAKMVDAIVNRNKPPEIVRRRRGTPEKVPLFPETYDWKEEERVRKALGKLYQDRTAELWDALVQRIDDRSYCIAVWNQNNGDGRICSVGGVCGDLAYHRLVDVFRQHLPTDPFKDGWPISLDVGITSLAEWRKKRVDKSFYQLQIEVCEIALRELAKVERVPDKKKTLARKKIEAEITKLRKTKEPIFLDEGLFGGYELTYTAEKAKQIRKAVESGSAEHLLIK